MDFKYYLEHQWRVPHVAGTIALIMQELNSKGTVSTIKNRLFTISTSNELTDVKSINRFLRTPLLPSDINPTPPPTTQSNECITISGVQIGKRCIFPFIFKNKMYNSCTRDGDPNNKPWCSVKVDNTNTHIQGNWGHCNEFCPIDGTPIMRPILKPTMRPINSPTTQSNECITISGVQIGKRCIFPFIFKNKMYNSCTRDGDPNNKPWCSVKVDNTNTHIQGNWGHCNEFCPIDSTPIDSNPTMRPTVNNNCLTIGGPRIGKKCIFPFIIGNNKYNKCTTDFYPIPWCSVDVNLNNNNHISGEWGYCNQNCLDINPTFNILQLPKLSINNNHLIHIENVNHNIQHINHPQLNDTNLINIENPNNIIVNTQPVTTTQSTDISIIIWSLIIILIVIIIYMTIYYYYYYKKKNELRIPSATTCEL